MKALLFSLMLLLLPLPWSTAAAHGIGHSGAHGMPMASAQGGGRVADFPVHAGQAAAESVERVSATDEPVAKAPPCHDDDPAGHAGCCHASCVSALPPPSGPGLPGLAQGSLPHAQGAAPPPSATLAGLFRPPRSSLA